jgi:hypothetical protein
MIIQGLQKSVKMQNQENPYKLKIRKLFEEIPEDSVLNNSQLLRESVFFAQNYEHLENKLILANERLKEIEKHENEFEDMNAFNRIYSGILKDCYNIDSSLREIKKQCEEKISELERYLTEGFELSNLQTSPTIH